MSSVSPAVADAALPRRAWSTASWAELRASALAAAAIAALAASGGGYAATTWGWAAVGLAATAAVAVIVGLPVRPGRYDVVFLVLFAFVLGWIALSLRWSTSPAATVLEIERGFVYLAALAAVLFAVRKASVTALLAGASAAVTGISLYGLLLRLWPDTLDHHRVPLAGRLSAPIGYWNAMAIFAAMGIVLALLFACRARTAVARGLAAASLVVLLPTLYLTFSRGGWLALGFGLLAAVVLDSRRWQLLASGLALAPAPLLAVLMTSRSGALATPTATPAQLSHAGTRLLPVLFCLALAAVATSLIVERVRPHVQPGRRVAGAARVFGIGLLAAAVLVTVARVGGPVTMGKKAYDAFAAAPTPQSGDLNGRLLRFSGDGRIVLWDAAWSDAVSHPWLGSGAGTYERYWLQNRSVRLDVRNAHNLYLETLAELGPAGLALLLAALSVPLVAAVKARRHPVAAGAFGAYAAYLLHAGLDWDWEMTSVTLTALVCGSALVVLARGTPEDRPSPAAVRAVVAIGAVALGTGALLGLVGNEAVATATAAARSNHATAAAQAAGTAARWEPWSPDPWIALGRLRLRSGDRARARASFRRAIAVDGSDWRAWFGLAEASNGESQRRALARAESLDPRSREIFDLRAELALRTPQ